MITMTPYEANTVTNYVPLLTVGRTIIGRISVTESALRIRPNNSKQFWREKTFECRCSLLLRRYVIYKYCHPMTLTTDQPRNPKTVGFFEAMMISLERLKFLILCIPCDLPAVAVSRVDYIEVKRLEFEPKNWNKIRCEAQNNGISVSYPRIYQMNEHKMLGRQHRQGSVYAARTFHFSYSIRSRTRIRDTYLQQRYVVSTGSSRHNACAPLCECG